MRRRWISAMFLSAVLSLMPRVSSGLFHASVINQLMTSYNCDPNVQFLEIRMLFSLQNFVTNGVVGAFDASGTYIGDVLVVPHDVAKSGAGVTWLLGTSQFATVSGVTPDFTVPPMLASGGGMVCWGAPVASNFKPVAPASWDHTNAQNYIDCLAYGSYSGPSNSHIGTPTTLTADGHSLLRGGTTNNNSADFAVADPATPKSNAGTAASLPATGACSNPTPTATAPPGPTVTPTVPPTSGCVGDCDAGGTVTVDELLKLVNIALENAQPSACPSGIPPGSAVNVALIVEAVNSALNGCGAT